VARGLLRLLAALLQTDAHIVGPDDHRDARSCVGAVLCQTGESMMVLGEMTLRFSEILYWFIRCFLNSTDHQLFAGADHVAGGAARALRCPHHHV